ncbi:SLOG family protein [Terrisporobacter sp.]|uniref:SLOG family protein n=1 Tax=Terrisporobacter sp. TaxID=1965305 RepID=UPI00260F329D|nr:SLOG family protein [Terrisporobacter sp.]
MKSIAFTGHRPDKLYGYDLENNNYKILKTSLYSLLKNEIEHFDADTFITGGALGFDTLVFEVVEELREYHEVYQLLAIPFRNQPNKWPKKNIDKYNQMKTKATNIYVDEQKEDKDYSVKGTSPGEYHPAKMQKRNEWMVDNCDMLIGCWDGVKKGGTWNCLKYAKKLNKEIVIINPKTFEIYYL